MASKIQVEPLVTPNSSGVDFGASVLNVDIEHLNGKNQTKSSEYASQWEIDTWLWNGDTVNKRENTRNQSVTSSVRNSISVSGASKEKRADWKSFITDADFATIREALFTHQILVFKNQSHVTPKAQYELTHRFDPAAASKYGHGDTATANSRSILHPDLRTIPHQPQVQVIGHGYVEAYEGLRDLRLRHPHHRTFHATAVPDHEDHDFTRFYRWHIDAALYGADLAPPVVTTLLAVKVPGGGRRQTCRYDDGSREMLDVPLGTTAFVSGAAMYEGLSAADKEFARTTMVEYAPHPYVWMSAARSRSDGLGLVSEGRELGPEDLPSPVDEKAIQILPMCWRNPITGQLALQVHPSAVRRLHLGDGTVVEDLERVREIVHRLQRPGIAPRRVYTHDWQEGDLVLFHNRGVLHSVVGAFAEDEVRLFRQCNIAGSHFPEGPSSP